MVIKYSHLSTNNANTFFRKEYIRMAQQKLYIRMGHMKPIILMVELEKKTRMEI